MTFNNSQSGYRSEVVNRETVLNADYQLVYDCMLYKLSINRGYL